MSIHPKHFLAGIVSPTTSALALAIALGSAVAAAAAAGQLPRNWPLAPSELERRFASGDFVILEVKGAGGGVTGAYRLLIEYSDGKQFKVKWKSVPAKSADGWNNSPRKELASYEVQRWLVDENDFLVPTSLPVCIPLERYAPIDPKAKPTLPGTTCVLGVLTTWLEDVTAPEKLEDKKRLREDEAFARYMADFNLLAYLIDHRDGRRGNVLLSSDAADPRVFAVDNGIAFGPFPWNFLVRNWNDIRVPWLRRDTVERLRRVDENTIERLGVIAELAADEAGVLRPVQPGPNLDDDEGVRIRKGRIQFGLTEDEIDDLEDRIEDLLKEVDSGKIALR
ncbi:MAG: hypothetical protein ABR538_06405 [Candidatus Binatia bacterium]